MRAGHVSLVSLLEELLALRLTQAESNSGKQTKLSLVAVPWVKCSSELHGRAEFARQVLAQRSDSHMVWYVESGGSPSGSRKGFMDKTRVISLYDFELQTWGKRENTGTMSIHGRVGK